MQHKNRHPIFRQIVVYATLRQSETMWHTGVFHIVERQAEEANAAISRKRFSSKVISCNATTERDDELYLSYCSLSSDEQRKQMRQFHGKVFLSKGVSCNATTERGDELYLSYCSLPSDEARTQMMTFHGKDFRQKRYYTMQTKISRTGSTGVRPVREIECAAAECRFSRKKEFTSSFLHWSSSQPWVRQPWRQRP